MDNIMDNCESSSLTPNTAIVEKKVYQVGDVIKLQSYGRGVSEYRDGYILNNGNQILEVEVKSVKVVRTILE